MLYSKLQNKQGDTLRTWAIIFKAKNIFYIINKNKPETGLLTCSIIEDVIGFLQKLKQKINKYTYKLHNKNIFKQYSFFVTLTKFNGAMKIKKHISWSNSWAS